MTARKPETFASEDKTILYSLISERLKKAFDPVIQSRGDDYLRAGWVAEPKLSVEKAELKIEGSKLYRVDVNWSRVKSFNEISISCSCPYYEGGDFCKHAWAALLKLDQLGIGQTIPGSASVVLLHSYEGAHGNEDEDEFEEDEYDIPAYENYRQSKPPKQSGPKAWLKQLKSIQHDGDRFLKSSGSKGTSQARNSRTAYYALDVANTEHSGNICIEFHHQETLQSGQQGAIKHQRISRDDFQLYVDPLDREIMAMLLGGGGVGGSMFYGYSGHSSQSFPNASVPPGLQGDVLKRLAKTERFFVYDRYGHGEKIALSFDEGKPWALELAVKEVGDSYQIDGFLTRENDRVGIHEPRLCLRSGIVVFKDRVAKLDVRHHYGWIAALRGGKFSAISKNEGDEFVQAILVDPHSPPVVFPESLQWKQVRLEPRPKVVFTYSNALANAPANAPGMRGLLVDLRFIYESAEVSRVETGSALLDSTNRRMVLRHFDRENEFAEKIKILEGVNQAPLAHQGIFSFQIELSQFAKAVSLLLSWGWEVEAKGKPIRQASAVDIKVSSGVDWFDLKGEATFSDGVSLSLPALISALQKQEHLVTLGDGTLGMLPMEWVKKYASLGLLGESTSEGLRFQRSQGLLLGALLAEDESMRPDLDFSKIIQEIQSCSELSPSLPEKSFRGKLRPYQKEGLGWLEFLRKAAFGGILADDMGLGKTVQLLAHLDKEHGRLSKEERRPSLVILPKSLMFNWSEEAERFSPKLKVVSYAGLDRGKFLNEIPASDLVLVTYATLRQDVEQFRSFEFHYVIADEAQSIKNRESLSYKACCLVRGRHRLAMTGTPVENSIDDLFSILDFVNPNLLGKSIRDRMSRASSRDGLEHHVLAQLSRALRPFILRRTKAQVLKDLPEKSEKILHCELSASEMKQYDELRKYYRMHLKGEIEKRGFARSKIVVLEALLRLRQAACHPGLIDKKRVHLESAKVETLLNHLKEVVSEGHKALVFSQFTSFMDIVEISLKRENISFERLDGKTKMEDRRARVSRFQEDPLLKVFLISLKAGGVGLNLTAADYVFILDPWWNPAVESQAIDRAHRIGQKNKVIAYRLIAKETVEEKILELQKSKRELAEAIVSADAGMLRKLTSEDLELLLS